MQSTSILFPGSSSGLGAPSTQITQVNLNGGSYQLPPLPKGIISNVPSSNLPLKSGSPNISATLPLSGGMPDIGSKQTRPPITISTNERGVFYYLSLKQWASKLAQIPRFGNKVPYLGHQHQITEGDICFSNSSSSSYSDSKNFEHQVVIAELAKLNEVLATGYLEIKQEFEKTGLGFSDGNTSKYSLAHTNGVDYRFIFKRFFKIINQENVDVSSMKINSLIEKYNQLFVEEWSRNNGVGFTKPVLQTLTDEEGEDENLYVDTSDVLKKNRPKVAELNTIFYPNNYSIYKKFFQNFPEKNRYKNSLCMFKEEDDKNFEMKQKKMQEKEKNKIEEYLKLLENSVYNSTDESQKILLKAIFTFAFTELLATSEKYIKFCTLSGVMNYWHFYGIANNTGAGKVGNPELRMDPTLSGQSHIVNFVVERNCDVTNRWGQNLPAGTKLWLIIKKIHPKGPYQVYPWHDKNNGINGSSRKPTEEDLEFVDEDGITKCIGSCIYVGTVRRSYLDNYPQETRRIANGISDYLNPVPFGRALEEKTNIASVGKIEIVM